jgi:hypothetical protein
MASAETHSTTADVHSASAEMPASAEVSATTAMPTAATAVPAATTASSEHRWRKGKRHSKRARDDATEELVVHPIPPELNCDDGYRRKKKIRRAKRCGYFK